MIDQATYPIEVRSLGEAYLFAGCERDRLPEITLASPPEFGGPPGVWSPEHLFVASIAACFLSTFEAVARVSQLPIRGLDVAAKGEMVRGEDRRFHFARIELTPRIVVSDERDLERALRLIPKAEQACLISRSVSAKVVVRSEVSVAAPEEALLSAP